MFEDMVLRRVFRPGEWRKLHNEELNDLLFTKYYLGDQIEKNEMGRVCGTYRGEERLYTILEEKPEGKRPLEITRTRWENNIKMDLQEVGCGGLDWIELAQDRERWQTLVNVVMNLWVQ